MKPRSRNAPPARNADAGCAVAVRRERGLSRKVSAAAIRRAVHRTLAHQTVRRPCSLTVFLAGEQTVVSLNARFRGITRGTDVLAFPAKISDPETARLHLGDVVLSLPQAARQAKTRRIPFAREVLLLVIHGTLHLLGHDHETAAEKKRMWRAQRQILKEAGS